MRGRTFLLVAAFLVLAVGGAVAVYAYDSAREERIADGVTIAGVDVSGLEPEAAELKLRRRWLPSLRRPVTVRWRGERFTLTARQARVGADLEATVARTLARSREGNVITRTVRDLSGDELDVALEPRVGYSRSAVRRLVARVARRVDRRVREADVSFSVAGPSVVEGRNGRRVRRRPLARSVSAALLGTGSRRVLARVEVTRPNRTTAEVARRYPVVLTVNRGAFRLSLYRGLKLTKSYPIAVGQAGLETPAGLYNIQNKAVNPAWSVPNSDWAGSLAGQVIPGGTAQNPLKARWMGIYDGAGIHGTDAVSSLGTNASHGCVRMAIPDVIELYDQVPVGAPIYIA